MLSVTYAAKEHWPQIEQVLARVWGDDDYVAESWLHWLEHPEEGISIVALWDGIPVGTAHVNFRRDGALWFHAMRIDPDYQGRGISGEMNRFAISELKKLGYSTAYAAIDMENIPSKKAAERSGFELLYFYRALAYPRDTAESGEEATASDAAQDCNSSTWQKAPLTEVPAYLAQITPYLQPPREWLMIGWEICDPDEKSVAEAICWDEDCYLRKWSSPDADAWAAIYDFDEDAIVMSPACSDPSQWSAALQGIKATLGEKSFFIWLTPDDPLYEASLAAGMVVKPDNGYEIWRLRF